MSSRILRFGTSPRNAGLLIALAVIGAADTATAQQRYRPTRPTVSPYLNLLRANTSPVPNYYTFVRPVQNQIAINREQEQQIIEQRTLLNELQNQPLQVAPGPNTGSAAWFRQPSGRAGFRNTRGYFIRSGRR